MGTQLHHPVSREEEDHGDGEQGERGPGKVSVPC